jgi:hypothetical protein
VLCVEREICERGTKRDELTVLWTRSRDVTVNAPTDLTRGIERYFQHHLYISIASKFQRSTLISLTPGTLKDAHVETLQHLVSAADA